MNREDQVYNALLIFADLIGARVAAHMKGTGLISWPEEPVLTAEEAADAYAELQKKERKEGKGSDPGRRLIAVTEWNKHYEHPKVGTLRSLIFHAETNGFSKVVRRVGRRVYLDEAAFFKWVDEQSREDSRRR